MDTTNKGLRGLQVELNNAIALIEDSDHIRLDNDSSTHLQPSISETSSLLERCEEVVGKASKKPILRLMHHFACSGGTLVSKCLAAQPNVFLLSELHPYSELPATHHKRPSFSPSDILLQSRYANIPNFKKLASEVFVHDIKMVDEHLSSLGGSLVVRLHTHSEFCIGSTYPKVDRIASLLQEYFELIHVVTIRDAVDAYWSLNLNGWKDFEPQTFDEYCKRLLCFVESHSADSIFFYEDFVDNPESEMEKILKHLELPYNESFAEMFSIFRVSGDSGRTGGRIEKRDKREMPESFMEEVRASCSYKRFEEYKTEIRKYKNRM